MSREHCCTLCGRRCRYARDVCSTCRVGTGLDVPRSHAWRLFSTFPRDVRSSWSTDDLRIAHAAYARGVRDDLTVAMDSEYRGRRRRRARCANVQVAS